MALAWTEALATGVHTIDDQHKEIFRRVGALLDATAKGHGQAQVDQIIQFLGSYVVAHFTAEEGLMVRAQYPKVAEHRRLHAAFLADFANLRAEYQRAGAGPRFIIELQKRVVDWLVNHIGKEDRAIGAYMRAKELQAVGA